MNHKTDMQALAERLRLLLSGDAILAKTDFARSTIEQAIAALASRPDAQADEVRAADPGDELQGWSVTVERNGVRLLTIEKDSVGGVENINDFAPLVRNCAEHLLSFIGRDAQAGERGAKLYRFIEAPEHILVGDEIWAQRSSEWQPVNPDFVDPKYRNWMPPIRRAVDQHEKSDLYKAGYTAGKKHAQESFAKLISCDPNDEALGLICEALALKPEGDITEAILGTIEELKTKVGIEAEAAQGVPENIEEGLEILDNFIANVRKYGNYSAEATLTFIAQARQCFAAVPSPDREQAASSSRECGERQGAAFDEIRDALNETYGFASTSPRGQENINFALGKLDEIEQYCANIAQPSSASGPTLGEQWPSDRDAAIQACALMILGICKTRPQEVWPKEIEGRIRYMLSKLQPQAAEPNGMTDEHLCAVQYAEEALRAIAERRYQVGDTIEPINDIRAASSRAATALKRFAPVARALLAKGE